MYPAIVEHEGSTRPAVHQASVKCAGASHRAGRSLSLGCCSKVHYFITRHSRFSFYTTQNTPGGFMSSPDESLF